MPSGTTAAKSRAGWEANGIERGREVCADEFTRRVWPSKWLGDEVGDIVTAPARCRTMMSARAAGPWSNTARGRFGSDPA